MKTSNEIPAPEGYDPSKVDCNFAVNGGKLLQEAYRDKFEGPLTHPDAEGDLQIYIDKLRRKMGLRTATEFNQPANYKKSVPEHKLPAAA